LIDSYEKGLVYEKLNGNTSTYKISEETGVPTSTIKRWVDEFVKNSLATGPDNHYTSSRALFNLVALKRRKTKESNDETRSVFAEEDGTAELIQRRLK
jgi:transposase